MKVDCGECRKNCAENDKDAPCDDDPDSCSYGVCDENILSPENQEIWGLYWDIKQFGAETVKYFKKMELNESHLKRFRLIEYYVSHLRKAK